MSHTIKQGSGVRGQGTKQKGRRGEGEKGSNQIETRNSKLENPRSPTPDTLKDALGKRLRLAVVVSILVNLVIWRAAASIAKHPTHWNIKPVEVTRVVIDTKGHKVEKIITKKQIQHKIAQVHKQIVKPKPPPPRIVRREPVHVPPKPRPTQAAHKPPEGAHHNILVAKAIKNATPPKTDEPPVLSDGKAAVGKETGPEHEGNAATNPPEPVKTQPQPEPAPAPAPVKTEPKPAPAPAPTPMPVTKPEPAPTPAPAPEPKHKGPTKDAEPDPDSEVKPTIPDDLKQGDYKSFVRVKVDIAADGSFTVTLRTSSGNQEIDNRVIEALKRWRWKPALKDGLPVDSIQRFKFEFEVQ